MKKLLVLGGAEAQIPIIQAAKKDRGAQAFRRLSLDTAVSICTNYW